MEAQHLAPVGSHEYARWVDRRQLVTTARGQRAAERRAARTRARIERLEAQAADAHRKALQLADHPVR